MHYGEIKNCDIANGTGVRITLFVSGCRNQCPHCFQKETWDFDYGTEFTASVKEELFRMLEPSYIDGLTVLGGEPLEPENQPPLLELIAELRERMPEKTVWLYTGFTLEEIKSEDSRVRCEATEALISLIDVLVDGRYVEEKKDISLQFRGSSNQRIIDMKKTRQSEEIVLWQE